MNGVRQFRAPDPDDVFELWNVDLEAGVEYALAFNPSGPAAWKMLLFGNPGASPYWPRRTNRILEAATSTTFTPAISGSYALVVINDNGQGGSYSVQVGTCSPPAPLASGVGQATPAGDNYLSYNQTAASWSAVGVRGDPGDRWEIRLHASGTVGPGRSASETQSANRSGRAPFRISWSATIA